MLGQVTLILKSAVNNSESIHKAQIKSEVASPTNLSSLSTTKYKSKMNEPVSSQNSNDNQVHATSSI